MPYKLTLFTVLRFFKRSPKAEDHHATGNSSMNYVQNLQGSLHNILHSINKFTFVFTVRFQETEIFLFVSRPPNPSNCWLNQHEQMLARAFFPSLGYMITLRLGKKNCGTSPFGKILFKIVHIRNLGDCFLLALYIYVYV